MHSRKFSAIVDQAVEVAFAEVAKKFFEYLKDPASMPAWEKANMMAKYYVSTAGVDLSNGK